MTKIILIAALVVITLVAPSVAAPSIENVAVTPNSAYLGEEIELSFSCFSANSSVQDVYVSITGPNIIIPSIQLTGGAAYSLILDDAYIDRTGNFQATIFCRDDAEESNVSTGFTVSEVKGGILSVLPEPAYSSDTLDVIFEIKKDGTPAISGVSFSVTADGQAIAPKSTVYDTTKGWIIRLDPMAAGTHDLGVTASFDRVNVSSFKAIEVGTDIEFVLDSLDKTAVKKGDNVTLKISALDQGNMIDLDGKLKVFLDSAEVQVKKLTNDGRYNYAEITMPDVSPRTYTTKASATINGYTYESAKPVEYVMPVSGEFVDIRGRALSVQIRFLKGSTEKLRLSTDGAGKYSGYITPDTYDVEFSFPESTLKLKSADVKEFDDPVFYSYITDVKVPGIKGNSIYVYESHLSYSESPVEINYREGGVDESDMKVFMCPRWNSARTECDIAWIEINADIDTSRNIVRIDSDRAAAFALGSTESITVSFNMEKKEYSLRDVVRVRGITQDSAKNPVPNAKIDIRLGRNLIGNLASDSNGVFSLEFLAPDIEGSYPIEISAEKQPYLRGKKEDAIDVVKLRSLSILFPESVRLEPGKNTTKEIIIINTGQDDIEGAEISVEGVPEGYYALEKDVVDVFLNVQEKIPITLYAPEGAESASLAGKIRVSFEAVTKEKDFSLLIAAEEKNPAPLATGFALDFGVPAIPALDTPAYLVIFAAACFATAIMLKRRKKGRAQTNDMTVLFDLKNKIKSRESRPVHLKEKDVAGS